jgi:ribose transport system ATP-binding protein/inositol transport system ATP-binding protein
MADRILVLAEGRINGELEKKDFNQELIMAFASGTANNTDTMEAL